MNLLPSRRGLTIGVLGVWLILAACAHAPTLPAYLPPTTEQDRSFTPIEGEPGYLRIHVETMKRILKEKARLESELKMLWTERG